MTTPHSGADPAGGRGASVTAWKSGSILWTSRRRSSASSSEDRVEHRDPGNERDLPSLRIQCLDGMPFQRHVFKLSARPGRRTLPHPGLAESRRSSRGSALPRPQVLHQTGSTGLTIRRMKIQVLSDLHLEHGGLVPEHHPDADVIVLAGDVAPYSEGLVGRLAEHWASAPHILYVLGNHEFYGTEIEETRSRLAEGVRSRPGSTSSTRAWSESEESGSSARRSGPTWCSKAKQTRSRRTCG